MAEKEVRKTSPKKTVRRTTTKTVPRRTAARSATAVPARKAPTRTVAYSSRKSSKLPLVMLVGFIVVVGISAAIGYSDKGQLDVSGVITQRIQNATPEEQELFKTVPVQQTNLNMPNGGLVATNDSDLPTPPPPTEQGATSTEQATSTASSTDSSIEEVVATEALDGEEESEDTTAQEQLPQ